MWGAICVGCKNAGGSYNTPKNERFWGRLKRGKTTKKARIYVLFRGGEYGTRTRDPNTASVVRSRNIRSRTPKKLHLFVFYCII